MTAVNENNRVKIKGVIVSELRFSHKTCGKSFFSCSLAVCRKSGIKDILPLLIPEDLLETERDYKGSPVQIEGQFRSFRRIEECKNKLLLFIFVTAISFPDDDRSTQRMNQVYLDGYVCRDPVFRKTPLGRNITDLFISVCRPFEKTDYIPCIAWNKAAKKASTLRVSSRVCITGRIQSRDYMKRLDDKKMVKKTTYEVSINRLDCRDQNIDISPVSCYDICRLK